MIYNFKIKMIIDSMDAFIYPLVQYTFKDRDRQSDTLTQVNGLTVSLQIIYSETLGSKPYSNHNNLSILNQLIQKLFCSIHKTCFKEFFTLGIVFANLK